MGFPIPVSDAILAVKAIWALGSINEPEADAALNELMSDPDLILAHSAIKQMKHQSTMQHHHS